ncbi:MAG: DNA polymerase III subunit alpha, partial [Firmicutes bacterium]|nr:DNA polymerase III subunit alpha [Bacillota bacterium]
RYKSITTAVTERLEYELGVIEQMGFPDYFLVVWDLARYARQQGIRYAGRGSVADSLVAYCLDITEVDSLKRGLLFERFMNPERVGMPDIDIDFESRHRDKVIDYVYKKYGAEHVARVATYNCFRARSALRELGKALGFPEAELDPLCKRMPFYARADQIRPLLSRLPELIDSPLHEDRFGLLLDCCDRLAGFPRFLGMHLGGLVISDIPITQLTPLQRSGLGPVISQFDKDDIEGLGLVKLDLLSLRTLSVIQDATVQIQQAGKNLNYEEIPLDDRATFAMINRGETIGVFQLESPAQRALQSRFNASEFEDVVASMALIRPGPIKGNMVEPYVARRLGREEVSYMHPWLEPILKKTYGVVLFQEQVIEIGRAIAGFSSAEADQLRRVMTHSRSQKLMDEIGRTFVARSVARGVEQPLAEEIFNCMLGYASYGFCEAHAAAFATTSYKTAYLIKHHPAEYYTAILNHQPMGFYPPRIIASEARRRGIKLLPPDVSRSSLDFTVEGENSIRVGLKQIKGLSSDTLLAIVQRREPDDYISALDFVMRTSLPQDSLENLVRCGALDSLSANRRFLLSQLPHYLEISWAHKSGENLLFTEDPRPDLMDFTAAEKQSWEYRLLGLHVGEHPMAAWRPRLKRAGINSSQDLRTLATGKIIRAAGLLLYPHRPPTRSGRITVFFSLEDEYGMIDVTMFEEVYMKYGACIFGPQNGPLVVSGSIQRRGEGISLIAQQVFCWTGN